jgi:hypothetical protein
MIACTVVVPLRGKDGTVFFFLTRHRSGRNNKHVLDDRITVGA